MCVCVCLRVCVCVCVSVSVCVCMCVYIQWKILDTVVIVITMHVTLNGLCISLIPVNSGELYNTSMISCYDVNHFWLTN